MNPERWEQISRVYLQALDCEPSARGAYLDQACTHDSDLRREVETLLAQDLTPGLMDRPMWDAASQLLDHAPALTPGARLGHYQIEHLLGAGGMGQVFRATDPRLNRPVALKVLLPNTAVDPMLRERFEREGQAAAALAHPHICTLHDVGRQDDVDFLVMECLEGETLAKRLESGPLPIERAVRYAIEIASALDHAHRHGIVHRDVKPANIMLTASGTKLMDFGIARFRSAAHVGESSTSITGQGAILGTVRYMSPEQVEGKDIDHRSDIFAFGVVVFEMITGKPAFDAGSAAGTMAAIVERELPPMATVQPLTPPLVDHVVRRCLAKNVDERWQSAGDVMRELIWALDRPSTGTDPTSPTSPVPVGRLVRRVLPWAAAGVGATAALILALWVTWRSPVGPTPVRFRVPAAVTQAILSSAGTSGLLAISPAGTHMAYVTGRQGDDTRGLMVHALARLEPDFLPGTSDARSPFFSPDGKAIGFFSAATRELRTVPIAGGTSALVCTIEDEDGGTTASWSANGTIVFATTGRATGLVSVPAIGGEPKVLTRPNAAEGELDHVLPSVLPDGRTVLFTITRSKPAGSELALLDVETGRYSTLIGGATNGVYVETGHVVYASGPALYAVPFDATRREKVGAPVAVEKDIAVTRDTQAAQFAVSRNGTLVYIPASAVGSAALRSLVWVNRQGVESPIDAPARVYHSLRLSPDDAKVALDARDEDSDTWVFEFRRPTLLKKVTSTPRNNPFPVWTPDGDWIVTGDAPGLARWSADGSLVDEPLTKSKNTQFPQAFTRDGRTLVLTDVYAGNNDLNVLTLDGVGVPKPLLNSTVGEGPADLSPDGRWIAYQRTEASGRSEVYISPFPGVNTKRVLVSPGTQPAWLRTSNPRAFELFYVDVSRMLTSVLVRISPEPDVSSPTKLFPTNRYFLASQGRSYDVSLDDQRFVFIKDAQAGGQLSNATSGSIVVVLNWIEELKARVSTQ